MTAELYPGMEIPDFIFLDQKDKKNCFHNMLKGTTGLIGIYGKQKPDEIAEIGRQIKYSESEDIVIYVLTDQSDFKGKHTICDPDHEIRNRLSPLQPCFLFLIDEKGKIKYAEYAESLSKLTDLIEILAAENQSSVTKELLGAILDAYPYEIIYVDRNHVVQYMNHTARKRYGTRVKIGNSLFNCHNEKSREKIIAFLKRADAGENEMFETYNQKTGEREFFVPVRNREGTVIGYFERHEAPWNKETASEPIGNYWEHRTE